MQNVLGGTEHRYSLQCITSFSKTNCCVCLCVPQLINSCNSSFHGLTHLGDQTPNHVHPLPFIRRKHSIKADTKLVPCHAMPCHVVSCRACSLPSPPSLSISIQNTPRLPPHPINPPAILPPLPRIRLPRGWLPPVRRLSDSLGCGQVSSCCCSPFVVS